jgi:hypothetical protein
VRPDCYEVGYVGHKNFTPNDTHYYATLRAAELVLQAGKPAFEILLTRDTLGQRNIYYPPTYDTITTTDAYGNIISTTTVETSPGYTITTDYPMTTILIRLLDSPRANSLNAAALSAGAIKSGIPLDPKTLARLGPAS